MVWGKQRIRTLRSGRAQGQPHPLASGSHSRPHSLPSHVRQGTAPGLRAPMALGSHVCCLHGRRDCEGEATGGTRYVLPGLPGGATQDSAPLPQGAMGSLTQGGASLLRKENVEAGSRTEQNTTQWLRGVPGMVPGRKGRAGLGGPLLWPFGAELCAHKSKSPSCWGGQNCRGVGVTKVQGRLGRAQGVCGPSSQQTQGSPGAGQPGSHGGPQASPGGAVDQGCLWGPGTGVSDGGGSFNQPKYPLFSAPTPLPCRPSIHPINKRSLNTY